MKKCMKIIYILLVLISIFLINNEVYATAGEIVSGGDAFISIGEKTSSPITTSNMQKLSNSIYNILLTIGIIIAFIIGGIIGIKYMIGGIEGQAEVKNALVPYVLGCVVVFGAFTIWKIVVLILQ